MNEANEGMSNGVYSVVECECCGFIVAYITRIPCDSIILADWKGTFTHAFISFLLIHIFAVSKEW